MQPDVHKEIELGSASLPNQIKLPPGCFITLFTTERHFSGTCNLLWSEERKIDDNTADQISAAHVEILFKVY